MFVKEGVSLGLLFPSSNNQRLPVVLTPLVVAIRRPCDAGVTNSKTKHTA